MERHCGIGAAALTLASSAVREAACPPLHIAEDALDAADESVDVLLAPCDLKIANVRGQHEH
eukprot:6194904-Pyramimonas_sp.AAC.1